MSVTALVTDKLIADPERRTSAGGKPFTLAKVIAHDGDADALVSVIAFGSVAEQLGALAKGDPFSITGRAKVNTWAGRDGATKAGLSVTAEALLTAYHVRRKRAAVTGDREAAPALQSPDGAGSDVGQDPWI